MKEFVSLLICHLLTTTSAQIVITEDPMDASVCIGNTVNISCGYGNDDPGEVPDWRIVRRDNGSVISNMTVAATEIVSNNDDGLFWVSDLSNPDNDHLVVGPVDKTYNQSSYQCSFLSMGEVVRSSIGTLTVVGIPTVNNLMATDNCDSVTTSWDAVPGVCRNSVQYNITLLTSSGDTIGSAVTSDTSYTFDELMLKGLTSEVTASVFAFNGNFMGSTSSPIAATLSVSNAPDIIITVVNSCVSYLDITWSANTQCVPLNYTVMLNNTSSDELQTNITDGTSFSFPRLTSNRFYTITVNGENRFGQDVSMILNSTLESNFLGEVVDLTKKFIDRRDINITWNAPIIDDDCKTSVASSYEVIIDYIIDTAIRNVSNITTDTNILLSYFDGHPMDTAIYNSAKVIAINERGHSNVSDSISLLRVGGGSGDGCFDKTWCIIVVVLCCLLGGSCIISCTSSSFIFICLRREEDSTITINIFMVTIGILSFGTAIPVWYIYDNCIRNKEDKDKDSSKDKRCFNILSIGSCGFVYVLNLLFDRPSKIKDRDAPDSQNMPLQHKDTNKPVRSAAEEQALYSYARTGPINVVVDGGSSARPGDKPRQT